MNNTDISSLCIYERHKRLVNEVCKELPQKIKDKLTKEYISVSDIFYESHNPAIQIDKEPLGIYFKKERVVHLIPKYKILTDQALKGLIAHELAHAYIDFTFCPLTKLFFRIRFNRIHPQLRPKHPEELHADWLAKKWGFEEEIDALNKERIINNGNKTQ